VAEEPRLSRRSAARRLHSLFVIDYFERGARFNVVDLYHNDARKDMQVWHIDYHRVYLRDDMESALQRAGFHTYSFYGNYEFQPYDKETSGMLIAVAQK
jgi:hypothetical protein